MHPILSQQIKRQKFMNHLKNYKKKKKTFFHLEKYEVVFHNRLSRTIGFALHILLSKPFSKRDSTISTIENGFKTQYFDYRYICES